MTVELGTAAQDRKRGIPPVAYIILALLLALGGGFWYLDKQSRNARPADAVLTPEAKAYVRNLGLSGVEMKATKSYLDQMLVEITGKITNNGARRLKSIELNCVFYDPYWQVVLRERVPIIRERSGGLAPGETKSFRLPFDTIPKSWNQTLPQLVIAGIEFE
jgi:hypothetical protein